MDKYKESIFFFFLKKVESVFRRLLICFRFAHKCSCPLGQLLQSLGSPGGLNHLSLTHLTCPSFWVSYLELPSQMPQMLNEPLFSHCFRGSKSEIKVSASLVSSKAVLFGLQTTSLYLCPLFHSAHPRCFGVCPDFFSSHCIRAHSNVLISTSSPL